MIDFKLAAVVRVIFFFFVEIVFFCGWFVYAVIRVIKLNKLSKNIVFFCLDIWMFFFFYKYLL